MNISNSLVELPDVSLIGVNCYPRLDLTEDARTTYF